MSTPASQPCRVLHLEDSPDDAFLIRRALVRAGLDPKVIVADTGEKFHIALRDHEFDVVVSDSSVPGLTSVAALAAARARFPGIPFFCISSAPDLVARAPSGPPASPSSTARTILRSWPRPSSPPSSPSPKNPTPPPPLIR